MVRPTKNTTNALEQDWFSEEQDDPFKKIKRILSVTEAKDSGVAIPPDLPIPKMSKVYGYNRKTKSWEQLGNKCHDCGKPLREGRVTEKHALICKRTLKINKEQEEEILARVGKPVILPDEPSEYDEE